MISGKMIIIVIIYINININQKIIVKRAFEKVVKAEPTHTHPSTRKAKSSFIRDLMIIIWGKHQME